MSVLGGDVEEGGGEVFDVDEGLGEVGEVGDEEGFGVDCEGGEEWGGEGEVDNLLERGVDGFGGGGCRGWRDS